MLTVIIIGLAAFLLFQVQPLMAKVLLPAYGGGAAVWMTSILFFQLLLLAGYAACHGVVKKGGIRGNLWFQLAIVLLSLLFVPLEIPLKWAQSLPLEPAYSLLLILLISVGLPYFVLSTTSPTLQYWMAVDPRKKEANPYLLYAVSNGGSLLGLLLYPLVVEIYLDNSQQIWSWSLAYFLYAFLVLAALASVWKAKNREGKKKRPQPAGEATEKEEKKQGSSPALQPFKWLAQSAIPAAALMAVTQYINVDIFNFPFLWVLPLAVYLLSFILAFSLPFLSRPHPLRRGLFWTTVLAVVDLRFQLNILGIPRDSMVLQILVANLFLFVLCLYFHGNLEREKPPKEGLTAFYFYLSLGGCLGSVFVVLVAPVIFTTTFEFEIMLLSAVIYQILSHLPTAKFKILAAVILMGILFQIVYVGQIYFRESAVVRKRSFYGTYQVVDWKKKGEKMKSFRAFYSGTTLHGGEARNKEGEIYPATYYSPQSGVGQYFRRFPSADRVGVLGLGAGMLALYGQKGQKFTFYEIDPVVKDLAVNYFQNIEESKAQVEIRVVDGRLGMEKREKNSLDVLILDAFSSDAVPAHLLTLEAMRDYLRVLEPGGVILANISNRYVDLWPVLNAVAQKLDLHISHFKNMPDKRYLHVEARWVVMTSDREKVTHLRAGNDRWRKPSDRKVLWTDDYSSLWPLIQFRR